MRRIWPRLYRLGVLVAIVWLVHAQHSELKEGTEDSELSVSEAERFFPKADSLGPPQDPFGLQEVRSDRGRVLGFVGQTSPDSDEIRGYVGASNVLLAFSPNGVVIGAGLRLSEDTADHVEAIVEEEDFWKSFRGLKIGAPEKREIDVVTGSTLTSNAITQGIITRLGGVATSDLFPTEILLVEAQMFLPSAAELGPHPDWQGVQRVLDKEGTLLGHALRTSPSQDAVFGYQGPTDIMIVLDKTASQVVALRFRKSYDNEEYYERILDDDDYLKLFDGASIEEVAGLDIEAAGLDVVSGATNTSWAIAESVSRRLRLFLSERDRQPPPFPLSGRDIGLILLTLGGIIMSFTRLRGKVTVRVTWQIVLVLYLGFYLGDLISQALLAGWAQQGVDVLGSIGLIVLVAASFVIPWTTGHQLYCHHLCPHGALQQWMGKLPVKRLKLGARVQRVLSALPLLVFVLVLCSLLFGFGLNLASVEAFDAYLFQVAGWLSLTIAVVGLVGSAFIPMAYCRYGCPTGLLFKFLRSRGAGDRFERRDWVAGGLLVVAVLGWALV